MTQQHNASRIPCAMLSGMNPFRLKKLTPNLKGVCRLWGGGKLLKINNLQTSFTKTLFLFAAILTFLPLAGRAQTPITSDDGLKTALEGSTGSYSLNTDVTISEPITVTNAITITGSGTIKRNSSTGGIVVEGSLTMSGIAFDGDGVTSSCSAFNVNGGTLTLTSCIIQDCHYIGENVKGGGVSVTGGTASFTDCTIQGNKAIRTDLSVLDASYGGGVYCTGGNLAFSRTLVDDNTSSRKGGGIYFEGSGTFTMNDSTKITNNTVYNTYDAPQGSSYIPYDCRGGGIYYEGSGTLNVTASRISQNKIYLPNDYSPSSHDNNGGGIFCKSGDIEIQGCKINGNWAWNEGAGICVKNTEGTSKLLITKNGDDPSLIINNNSSAIPGGSLGSDRRRTVHGTGIYYHSEGGTIAARNCLIIEEGTIVERNGSGGDGAQGLGIYIAKGQAKITDSYIRYNSDIGGNSGGVGVYAMPPTVLAMDNCEINNNTKNHIQGADYHAPNGAGLHISGDATLTNCKIYDNSVSGEGGGIHFTNRDYTTMQQKTLTLNNCHIYGNHGSSGGGIFVEGLSAQEAYADYTGIVNIHNCKIGVNANDASAPNTASSGGGIYLKSGVLNIDQSTQISYNTANTSGGGIYVDQGLEPKLVITGTAENPIQITNNHASKTTTLTGGGGIYLLSSNSGNSISHCNIQYNHTDMGESEYGGRGGGICIGNPNTNDAFCQMTDCSITGNTAQRFGGGIYFNSTAKNNNDQNDPKNVFTRCIIQNNSTVTTAASSTSALNAYGGGGVYLYLITTSKWVDCTISNNSCTSSANCLGGGVFLYPNSGSASTTMIVEGTTSITGNATSGFGGGVYLGKRAVLGVEGTVTINNNTTTRGMHIHNDNDYDDVCIQTLNNATDEGIRGKIVFNGALTSSNIGITEQQVVTDAEYVDFEYYPQRQFTANYATHMNNGSKVLIEPNTVFFSNDRRFFVKQLAATHTSTSLIEATLVRNLAANNWYVAGIVDDDGFTWGNDDNSGRNPDVPKRTLTGPNGVFASGYNPETDHVFVVRAISATEEAKVRLTSGKVVVRYPKGATASTFLNNTTSIPDSEGSEEIILHRYPGGHTLSTTYTISETSYTEDTGNDNGTTNFGSGATSGPGSTRLPGANIGPLFYVESGSITGIGSTTVTGINLYDIHMDGMSDLDGLTDHEADPDDLPADGSQDTHNPKRYAISPKSALLSSEGATPFSLNESCELIENNNKQGTLTSGKKEQNIGGGVYAGSDSDITFNSSGVHNNNCATHGGGFYIDGSGEVTLNEGCRVTENTATSPSATNYGGGVYINANAAMKINGSGSDGVLIQYNHAKTAGGGVYKMGTLKVEGFVVITDNTVDAE